jgi:meiotically up-regulated gene 157 (Mug157) protein
MFKKKNLMILSVMLGLTALNSGNRVLSETESTLRRPHLPAVEKAAASFNDPNKDLEHMYRSGLLNAVTKQSFLEPDGSIYVQTGDIPAEWLRDSSAQVRPYLYFVDDKEVRDYMKKVIARQAEYITIDPYANAFKENKGIWEQKYELDSLCYPILLAWTYWRVSNDSSIFTPEFQKAMHKAFETMKLEQDHEKNSKYTHKELTEKEKDRPVGITGMVWSGFRPSDDACRYHYLIPSEMMAVSALKGLEQIEKTVYKDEKFAAQVATMRQEIDAGIHKYGVVTNKDYGKVFAFEVDGLGNHILLDDANIPSLLSAPYLGYVSGDDPIYQNTRKMLLSKANKNYASGKVASGIGSEHTPAGYIWPLAMIMQGITEKDPAKVKQQVKELLACDPGDHLLHESFDPDDQKKYTRPDFGWPNALFAEFIMLKFQNKKPLPLPS